MNVKEYYDLTCLLAEEFTLHPIYGKQKDFFKVVLFFSRIFTSPTQTKKEIRKTVFLFVSTILRKQDVRLELLTKKDIVDGLKVFFTKDFYNNNAASVINNRKVFKNLFYFGGINLFLLHKEKISKNNNKKFLLSFLSEMLDNILLNYDYFLNKTAVLSREQELVFPLLFELINCKKINSNIKILDLLSDIKKRIQIAKQNQKESNLKKLPIEKLKSKMKKRWDQEKGRIPKKDSILFVHPKDFNFNVFSQSLINDVNLIDRFGFLLNIFARKINLLTEESFLKLKESFIDFNEELKTLILFTLEQNEYVSTEFLFNSKNETNQLVQLFYIAVFIKLFPKTKKVFIKKKNINSEYLNYFYVTVLSLAKIFRETSYSVFAEFISYLNDKFNEDEIVDLFYYLSKEEIQEKGESFFNKDSLEKILSSYTKELFKVIAILRTLKKSQSQMVKNFPKIEKSLGKYKITMYDKVTLKSLFAGIATNCCQVLGGAGQECVYISAVEPDATIVTVEKYGYIYAQSYTWRVDFNGVNVIVFDSLELPREEVKFADTIKQLYIELSKELVNSGACDIVILSLGGGGDKISNVWQDFKTFANKDILIKYPFEGYNDFSGSLRKRLICLAGDISKIKVQKKTTNLNILMKELSSLS